MTLLAHTIFIPSLVFLSQPAATGPPLLVWQFLSNLKDQKCRGGLRNDVGSLQVIDGCQRYLGHLHEQQQRQKNIEMSQIKAVFILLILSATLKSCLVTTAPRYHYFISTNNIEKDSIKVTIFSTPKYKLYVVTNTDLNAQVLIKSPVFENPNEFYLMQNYDFFEKKAKQYKFIKRDGKYYRNDNYKRVTLKIISEGGEKVINYKVADI